MANISMKELLEAGVHFGHQTKRWNPKMKEYIFGERNGIYIIDLQKTLKMFKEASNSCGTSPPKARRPLRGNEAPGAGCDCRRGERCGMFYVNNRWLGGLLTNWVTVQKSVKRLKELDDMATDGRYELLPKKEVIKLERERKHLQANLAGIKNMNRLPDAIFVIDSNKEQIAVTRSPQAGHPGGCGRRYELRSERSGLHDSGQRRCAARDPSVCLEDCGLGGRRRTGATDKQNAESRALALPKIRRKLPKAKPWLRQKESRRHLAWKTFFGRTETRCRRCRAGRRQKRVDAAEYSVCLV